MDTLNLDVLKKPKYWGRHGKGSMLFEEHGVANRK